MEHKDYISALREIADFYEAHPEVKLPYEGITCPFGIFGLTKTDIATTVRAFGKCKKVYGDDAVNIYKEFSGGVQLNIYTPRATVCTRVVVGTVIETEKIIPGEWVDEVVVPQKEVEVAEWRCDPILEDAALTEA